MIGNDTVLVIYEMLEVKIEKEYITLINSCCNSKIKGDNIDMSVFLEYVKNMGGAIKLSDRGLVIIDIKGDGKMLPYKQISSYNKRDEEDIKSLIRNLHRFKCNNNIRRGIGKMVDGEYVENI